MVRNQAGLSAQARSSLLKEVYRTGRFVVSIVTSQVLLPRTAPPAIRKSARAVSEILIRHISR